MRRKFLFLILPVLLILSAAAVYYLSSKTFGKFPGYLTGFAFYWLFWCLIIPYIINRKSLILYFKSESALFEKKNWWVIILFFSTIIAPVFMYFIPGLSDKSILIIILAVPFAIIDGFCEELFWRGFYVNEFRDSILWGIFIPSVFFSLWHFTPQIVFPHDNQIGFVISTLCLGLTYGIVAYKTKSAKWSAIGHSISGILAFSGSLSFCFVKIIS
jgi:membrane protease YdiL (CAAX protease family)